jgi:hypothetical protein
MKPYHELKPYYTLSVPLEIMEAAERVKNYFAEQGVETWELGGICSRNIAYKLHEISEILKKFDE